MSDEKIDVLAVMDAEVVTMRRLESWVNEALAPTNMNADEAVARMEAARDAVADLIEAAGEMMTTGNGAYRLQRALARVRSS